MRMEGQDKRADPARSAAILSSSARTAGFSRANPGRSQVGPETPATSACEESQDIKCQCRAKMLFRGFLFTLTQTP